MPDGKVSIKSSGIAYRPSSARSTLVERKLVTVMIVDMIGSLAAIRDIDPEEAHELISHTVSVMTEAIHEFGGTVMTNTGDGVLAIFGAPVAQEDHAARSCYAALGVLERLREAGKKRHVLKVRIGLHSGEVAVGTVTNDFSVDYEATGATVHIASRMEGAAPEGRAVMSAATRSLVPPSFATEPMGLIKVKGLDEPMELFALCASRVNPPPDKRFLQEPFVGREAATAQLQSAFGFATRGSGRAVALIGEAGVGKSTLIERFVATQPGSFRAVKSSADRYRSQVSLHPFRALLLDLLKLTEVEAAQRGVSELRENDLVAARDDHREAAILELLEIGDRPPHWRDLDPKTRGKLILSAILDELIRESRRQPLIVIIEDLQWIDSSSLEVLSKLTDVIKSHEILLLLTYRPEFRHSWAEVDAFLPIHLGRLKRSEAKDLVERLIGDEATPLLKRRMIDWSQGNPLFLREIIRTRVGDPKALEASQDAQPLTPPASIRAIIAERIDRLPSGAKGVLLAASVLGEKFVPDLVVATMSATEEHVAEQLKRLEQVEFVQRSRDKGKEGFRFCHPLFQEIAYSTLLRQRRLKLHAAAFATLKTSGHAGSSPAEEILAYHAFCGHLWGEAFVHCRAAGQKAASRSALREAVSYFQNATTALGRAGLEETNLGDAIDVRLELRTVLVPLFQLSAAEALVKEAHVLALKLGDKRRLAQVIWLMAVHAYLQQGPKEAKRLSRRSLALAREIQDAEGRTIQIGPNICLAQSYYALGRYAKAAEILEYNTLPIIANSVTTVPLGLPGHPFIISGYWIAISKAELGLFREAEGFIRKMASGRKELQAFDEAYAETAAGFVQMLKGDYGRALRASTRALETAQNNDLHYLTPVIASQVGLLLANDGDRTAGLRLGLQAVKNAQEIGVYYAGRSRWYARLAEICLLTEKNAEAMEHVETAIAVAEKSGEWGYYCSAVGLRARISMALDLDPASARADLIESLIIARRLAMKPTFAKHLFHLAVLERKMGNTSSAIQKFSGASKRFRRCGMLSWERRARHELSRGV